MVCAYMYTHAALFVTFEQETFVSFGKAWQRKNPWSDKVFFESEIIFQWGNAVENGRLILVDKH